MWNHLEMILLSLSKKYLCPHRSGLEFIISIVEETKEGSENTEPALKSQEVVETIEELDEKISRYWRSPSEPFGAEPGPFDLAGVPESHTWWGHFRGKSD